MRVSGRASRVTWRIPGKAGTDRHARRVPERADLGRRRQLRTVRALPGLANLASHHPRPSQGTSYRARPCRARLRRSVVPIMRRPLPALARPVGQRPRNLLPVPAGDCRPWYGLTWCPRQRAIRQGMVTRAECKRMFFSALARLFAERRRGASARGMRRIVNRKRAACTGDGRCLLLRQCRLREFPSNLFANPPGQRHSLPRRGQGYVRTRPRIPRYARVSCKSILHRRIHRGLQSWGNQSH